MVVFVYLTWKWELGEGILTLSSVKSYHSTELFERKCEGAKECGKLE